MAIDHLQEFERHVAAVRKHEPTVHALIFWDEEEARRRAEAAGPGLLSGWAVGVKDIINAKGLPTRHGTDFLPDTPAEKNAAIVDRLESLGAYVFSKVVTTVFAYFDPGPTTNPWNPEHTPGGSSMGSAAATTAGMVRVALGSQTIGSIGRPASFCGVAGFKPTYERTSLEGVLPFSPSVDTVGFFTRGMADLKAVSAAVFDEPEAEPPSSPRIGVIEDMYCEPADDEMLGAVREVAGKLESAGFNVRSTRFPEALKHSYENHLALVAGELATSHRELFERYRGRYPPKVSELILKGQRVSAAQLQDCLGRRRELEAELDTVFDEFDFLLTPAAAGAALKGLAVTGDPRMSLIFTHTRTPALTIPATLNHDGLPLGVQLAGRRMRDAVLLAGGLEIESVIDFRPFKL